MVEREIVYVRVNTAGHTAGIIACFLAVLGIFTFGMFFVPFAAAFAFCGLLVAILNMNGSGIAINLFAWILVVVGVLMSPMLLALLLTWVGFVTGMFATAV